MTPEEIKEIDAFEREHNGIFLPRDFAMSLCSSYERHGKTCRAYAIDRDGETWFWQCDIRDPMLKEMNRDYECD